MLLKAKEQINKQIFKQWLIGVIEATGEFKYNALGFNFEIRDELGESTVVLEKIKKELGDIGDIKRTDKGRNQYMFQINNEKEIKEIIIPIMEESPLMLIEKQLEYLHFYNKIMQKEAIYKGILVKTDNHLIRVPDLKNIPLEDNIYVKIANGLASEDWEAEMEKVSLKDPYLLGIMTVSDKITMREFFDEKKDKTFFNIYYTQDMQALSTTMEKANLFKPSKLNQIYEKNKELCQGSVEYNLNKLYKTYNDAKKKK